MFLKSQLFQQKIKTRKALFVIIPALTAGLLLLPVFSTQRAVTASALNLGDNPLGLINVIEVNTQQDELNNDGDCSLREAIQAANTNAAVDACAPGGSEDLIVLEPGTYSLTLGGNSEDNNLQGDLDVNGTISIIGLHEGTAIIQSGTSPTGGIDRIFHVLNGNTTLTLQNLTLRYGRTEFGSAPHINGGGIYISNGTLHLRNSILHDNTAANGGAIASDFGLVNITDTLFYNNDGGSGGGGVLSLGTTNIWRSTFHDNYGEFGGVLSRWLGTINVYDTVFYNNSADYGGVANGGAALNLYNSTLSGNTASNSGGAIRNFGDELFIYNSTIVSNTSASGGGIWTSGAGDVVNFTNTIVANNTGSDCLTLGGVFVSNDYNLDSDGSCSLAQPNDLPNTDPMLAPINDNGGPTLTHALLPLSPAIDAGDCSAGTITADQRGVTRPQETACDIGAFELAVTPYVQALSDQYILLEDSTLNIASPGVLSNDLSYNPITAALIISPTNGSLTLNADGSFTYTPDQNFNGVEIFHYQAGDGILTDTAAVTLTIISIQDIPVLADDFYTTTEDILLFVPSPGVLGNDNDNDGDVLTVITNTQPAAGTVDMNTNGSFFYFPPENYNGTVNFTYSATDGFYTEQATVTLMIFPAPDAPIAVNDVYTTTEDFPLIIAPPGVLANDSDPDGDMLVVFDHTLAMSGTVTVDGDGSILYTPSYNFYGTDTFTYTVSDGTLMSQATVTINVLPVEEVYLPVMMRP